ncbi:MAG TPA: ABC transporter ATP-binding protein [Solirubrobacteraceae bacterium]|nr:ABC transporter ATP-binding protein [Solirubrobacteraceae bacterium]
MSVLQLRDVVKHYPSGEELIRAVDHVSLTISEGEFVGLYGPSGSGKTTLLLIAAGLLAPDQGSVRFGDRELSHMSAAQSAAYRLRDVGFVFQTFHLIGGASALNNAAIKLLADGLSLREAQRRAQPWLERVGLGGRAEHPPERLSMGERQRVAIARALVNEPRLLLTDEPTGNLDSARSSETLGLLRDICHERRIPGLLVTHDPLAGQFVDRVHTLKDGCIHDGLQAELGVASVR